MIVEILQPVHLGECKNSWSQVPTIGSSLKYQYMTINLQTSAHGVRQTDEHLARQTQTQTDPDLIFSMNESINPRQSIPPVLE